MASVTRSEPITPHSTPSTPPRLLGTTAPWRAAGGSGNEQR